MKSARRNRKRASGFTLIEIAITVAIVGGIVGALVQVLDSSKNTFGQGSVTARTQTEARRGLDRVLRELENSGSGTLLPNPVAIACDDLVYQVASGVDIAAIEVTYDPSSRLRLALEPSETDNGVDDDRDGLVDERCIEFTRDYLGAGEQTVILVKGVAERLEGELQNGADDNGNGLIDEPGFCVTRTGNVLRVRLTLARSAPGPRTVFATVDSALRLKN